MQTATLQKTIGKTVRFEGKTLHGGSRVELKLHPAKVGHGLVFARPTSGGNGYIPALWSNVCRNTLQTVLGNEDGVEIATVEHVLAALAGYEIDNALIEVNGGEVPVGDGSAAPFCRLIEEAGVVLQNELAEFVELDSLADDRSRVRVGGSGMRVSPSKEGTSELTISYTIDFPDSPIGNQNFIYRHKSASDFVANLAPARTFCLEKDIQKMRNNGFALGGCFNSALVFGEDGILNPDELRFADEPVRHKVLDCLGDLALAGKRIRGSVSVVRGGHATHIAFLNNLLGRKASAKKQRALAV